MTPIWREMMKESFALEDRLRGGQASRTHENMKKGAVRAHVMGSARAFDLREIERLCFETGVEIREAAHFAAPSSGSRDAAGPSLYVDLGERTILPAPATWIEFSRSGVLFSVCDLWARPPFVPIPDGSIVVEIVRYWSGGDGPDQRTAEWCGLKLSGGHAEIMPLLEPVSEDLAMCVVKGLAGLAAINSPAAKADPVEAHRGFERVLRARGISQIAHTKVTIGRARSSGGDDGDDVAPHPRAYHFCRAHVRIKRGRVEQVRAHWRGDPAFGVRLPSYQVRPPPENDE